MSLYSRIRSEGLSPEQRIDIFRTEMIDYRNALEHERWRWEANDPTESLCSSDSSLRMFRELWGHIAEDGVPTRTINDFYLRQHVPGLEPLERQGLTAALSGITDFGANFEAEVAQRLMSVGLDCNVTTQELAKRIVAAARAQAAHSLLIGAPDFVGATQPLSTLPPAAPALLAAAVPLAALPVPATAPMFRQSDISVPAEWANRTALQIAELMIKTSPKLFEHREGGKRASTQTEEHTKRQLKWAATLFDKSRGGKPYWSRTREDVTTLDKWFERLPTTIGKSPSDRAAGTTFEEIEARALERIEDGDLSAGDIGLTATTTNKHYRFLAQIDKFAMKVIPGLQLVGFNEFCSPDLKNERDARDRVSNEQAECLFHLPPWTGCASLVGRIEAGKKVWHDGLFWVLPLVWYSGARREEICKLMLENIGCCEGIWFLEIKVTVTGRVKNASAIRLIPICEELIRLGFIEYVKAMETAGERLLFPELQPGGITKRKLGDVFYKLWWIYLAPLVHPALLRGQAMHACRHSVSDELKQAEVFIESRNDLLGWKGTGGQGETRYPKATLLRKLKAVVDLIPVVTGHLPGFPKINLLPSERRVARPTRSKPVESRHTNQMNEQI